ncbi:MULTISPECIES: hypothetical protein [Paenibacillus]|uniref:Uncharacterized protein n=1 Tax=Paenibacillus albilobatus TaxID=2716884 RepID=A0A919XF88_9BACL|nr:MULTISPECIES: hypothetical protein [Paenibacillus]MDR9855127.1 hypothetical protein [Paenibacillus sp. VCA1]GIO29495.1 hypothetical protein J2TS6_06360 [Paenibacillus albilobatus]
MSDQLNAAKAWLEQNTGETLLIRKEERDDIDETRVRLKSVEYDETVPTFDEYAEGSSLILHGPGNILGGHGDLPLPRDQYQIYVDGKFDCSRDGNGLSVTTGRAKYHISVIS